VGCPFKGRGNVREKVMGRDFEVVYNVFARSDVITGISVSEEISLSAQDNRKNNDEYDFCNRRQKPEGFRWFVGGHDGLRGVSQFSVMQIFFMCITFSFISVIPRLDRGIQ
jgi:hypothetical protein